MTVKKIIQKSSLGELFKKIKEGGARILAPVEKEKGVLFAEVDSYDAVAVNYVQTILSPKEAVLPRFEELLRFNMKGTTVVMEDTPPAPAPTVLYGVRPCDARSFPIVNAVFAHDIADAPALSRFENTSIIGISCSKSDEYCFCTSVGGAPDDRTGSDILLTPAGDGAYLADIVSDRGAAIVALAPGLFSPAGGDAAGENVAAVPAAFDLKALEDKLPRIFDGDVWIGQSLRCLGCGACSYACPACTCFDIQDETAGEMGARLRCWDSCGFGQFTLHTSGHNPRPVQSQRWRQRIMHKFSYQPERLQAAGCVGCGRCSRACPADMNILQHILEIVEAR